VYFRCSCNARWPADAGVQSFTDWLADHSVTGHVVRNDWPDVKDQGRPDPRYSFTDLLEPPERRPN
jgi:hypothetical protein